MKLFKFLAAVAAVVSLGFGQSASATTVTYTADVGQDGGNFLLLAPDANRPTFNVNTLTVNNFSATVNDVAGTVSFSGILNFNNYTITSNPVNNAQNWINASQGNYSVTGGVSGLNVANNGAGTGQLVAAFYGAGTSSTHTSDISLLGLQSQNWCSVPGSCAPNGGNQQYIGGWALANGSLNNLAFGITNLGNNTFSLVAWYKDMGYGFVAQYYQIDLGITLRGPSSPPPGGAVPEPATMALLASGAIPLLRRKMKKA